MSTSNNASWQQFEQTGNLSVRNDLIESYYPLVEKVANATANSLSWALPREDLISIGAFSPGSNKRIDGSVALIDRIQNFLIQPIRERGTYAETVETLVDISRSWDELLTDQPAALPAAGVPNAIPPGQVLTR